MGTYEKITIVGFLLLISISTYSQNRRFHHITSKDGLSQSEVYCFLKDSRGFMWFGTVDGLNCYDGYSIKTFTTQRNNPQSLSNNTIRSLAEDQSGRVWIGTDDGLNMYNPHTESIYQITSHAASSHKFTVSTLLVYEDYLFLGTRHGLFRLELDNTIDNNRPQRIEFDTGNTNLNRSIINLKECSKGGIWMQTSSFVSRIIVESHSNVAITIETPIIHPSYNFLDLVEDYSNNLWISCNRSGLIRYNLTNKQITKFKPSAGANGPSSLKCSGISVDLQGNIWLGTLDNGLNFIKSDQVNSDKIRFKHIQYNSLNPSSLTSNLIRALYVSNDDVLWIGTIGAGVNFFDSDQKQFEHLSINTSTSNGSNFIRSVYYNTDNKIWAGTHSNGLYQINRATKKVKKLGLENMTVFYIAPYNENKKLICCDEGLLLIEESNGTVKILSHLKTFATFYITKGAQDYYWLASFNGIFRLKITDDSMRIDQSYPLSSTESASPQNCRMLFYNKLRNELLVGTEGGGLHILSLNEAHEVVNDKIYKSSKQEGSISNNYIRSIIQDSNNNFWIGTYEGLNKVVNDSTTGKLTFKCYTTNDGLPNNMIHSIIEDDAQCLWIGTNNGLSKFYISQEQFINYTESDGIQSNEFSEHTAYKTKNGEIIMGGINGITAFYPSQITSSLRKPQTTITDLFIDGERVNPKQRIGKTIPLEKGISISDTLVLLPHQNNIGFDFSSMLYPNAEKIKYAYKLEGFDKNWQYTDVTKRHANYTNLRHGKYAFKVKSTNSDGIWEDNGTELFIYIKTPFIYTWYAYVLYLLTIVLIFIYFSYYSIIRYTTKNKLLLEQEHNNKVQVLNKLRTEFFINISHDLRTPLTLIKGPLESILQKNNLSGEVKEQLLLIKRNVKRLNYLIEQLLDVRKAESGKLVAKLQNQDIIAFTKEEIAHFTYAIRNKGLKYQVSSSSNKLMLSFDPAMIAKVYFNLISNALKYTDIGEINISIAKVLKKEYQILNHSKYNSFAKIEVHDTGKGISTSKLQKVFERFYQDDTSNGKGYGIGLSHTRELIEAHSGYIEAESQTNKGTTIRFFIPDTNLSSTEETKSLSNEDDMFRGKTNELLTEEAKPINNTAKTVLVVEDNADMRSYIKSELITEFNVLEAEDGLIGIEMVDKHDVDLIISDIMMPNLDGMAFCQHIKTNIKTSHIPIILLTAKTDNKSKYEGIETGADDYISKPFEMEYLILRIKNLLQSREQLRKIFQSKGFSLEPSAVTVNTLDEKFLKDLMDALEKGIPDSEFNVSTLEEELGMSHSNFYRKVKSLTGQSGKELLNEMRMNRAKQVLMDNNSIRIDEVAYMVGFTSPKYFGKSFKEAFGMSPSEMKRMNH
ncbi:response regulator [Carboxylicivirga sp. A043]|uniref:hybrid sensor histidine kinase/response regulator transcription factor n=1 Tax=Carboxylicivirga litoralis TaxID=2816963 RepID=UPI0021CB6AF7|nr:two-component regulator propeller domain-containing protein [Carboxylicivirga sp. A043]MCU4157869.1 response regulator [Carboxylicivirga sp. A043]